MMIQAHASGTKQQPALLKIASHELAPYHWATEQNELTGPALKPLQCTLEKLNQRFEIRIYPWRRAQELVRHKLADAFFIGSRNQERDHYAEFATPFYFDKWFFYYNKNRVFSRDEDDMKKRYLGVLMGSNMEQWARNQSFDNLLAGRDFTHLFTILDLGRLDAVMATEGIYNEQMKRLNWNIDHFPAEKVHDLQMGIYLGKHVTQMYPSYLERFNNAVETCVDH